MENNKLVLTNELRVRGVPKTLKQAIENIAKNEGTTMSAWVKQQIRPIVNSYPENMKKAD